MEETPPSVPQAQPHGTSLNTAVPNHHIKKVVVAVHGVGDQYSYATLQSVVNQFCEYYQQPLAVPLGQFHGDPVSYCLHPPYPAEPFQSLAFAEVYWAKIPRALVSEQHTLEEAKAWAGTIVERLRLRWQQEGRVAAYRDADFTRLKQVLSEMVQTLAVLERLSFLAERAGLFTFDLRKLLDDYLGDVQVVAEFGKEREAILTTFRETLTGVHRAYPQAEIHLMAHSEGTVITLLGLLTALREGTGGLEPGQTPWVNQVRGLMTIGSPIDKHLILWPELFPKTSAPAWPEEGPRIEWRNYYDRGDPIGFALDDARQWIGRHKLTHVFHFKKAHDYGFTRYPFPGKAHVGYWQDPAVFGHFIETVVNRAATASQPPTGPVRFGPPRDIKWKKWLSYGVPYLGILALLFVGTYVLFKAITKFTAPQGYHNDGLVFRQVANLTLYVAGLTVAARIPRLTSSKEWRTVGVTVFALLAFISYQYLPVETSSEQLLRAWVSQRTGVEWAVGGVRVLVATAAMLLSWATSLLRPGWGLAPLLVMGTLVVLSFVGYHYVVTEKTGEAPLWPVFPAAAAFFYLWWLSALLFDLVFVWHVHIRQEMALAHMEQMVAAPVRPS